jgi:hypothetical protein
VIDFTAFLFYVLVDLVEFSILTQSLGRRIRIRRPKLQADVLNSSKFDKLIKQKSCEMYYLYPLEMIFKLRLEI